MSRLARYTRVLTDFWRAELREEPRGLRFIVHYADPQAIRPLSRQDAVLAGIVQLCRITYGDAFAPLEATVGREPLADPQRFEDWFRAPIVWGAPQPSLLCRREDLARPLATTNPGIALASERLVADYLARLDRDDVVAQVKRELLGHFPTGTPTQATVARAVGLSARTLHRRLAEAGTSFEKLLDETRRELAVGVRSPHRLFGRRGRVPARLRRDIELQPRVPAVEREVAERVPARRSAPAQAAVGID